MKELSLLLLPLLIELSTAGLTLAKVFAECKANSCSYWQKVEQSNGIRHLCSAQAETMIQKIAQCTNVGAVRSE